MRFTTFRGNKFMYLEQGLDPYYMFEGYKQECQAREFCLRDNEVVVDVGACIGGWTIPAAIIGKHVYAFEPNAYWAKILSANAYLNRLNDKVSVETSAVWNRDEDLTYDGWSIADNYDQPRSVKGVKLDSLALEPDFIKIDVEGGELKVIEGAEWLIRERAPRLLIEAHKQYNMNMEHEVIRMVKDLNRAYNVTTIWSDDQISHLYFEK